MAQADILFLAIHPINPQYASILIDAFFILVFHRAITNSDTSEFDACRPTRFRIDTFWGKDEWECHDDDTDGATRVLLRRIEILDITTAALIIGTLYIGKPMKDPESHEVWRGSVIEFDGGGSIDLTDDEHRQLENTAFFSGSKPDGGIDPWDEYLDVECDVLAQLAAGLEEIAQELDKFCLLL